MGGHSQHSKLTADPGNPQPPHETGQEQSQPPNSPQWLWLITVSLAHCRRVHRAARWNQFTMPLLLKVSTTVFYQSLTRRAAEFWSPHTKPPHPAETWCALPSSQNANSQCIPHSWRHLWAPAVPSWSTCSPASSCARLHWQLPLCLLRLESYYLCGSAWRNPNYTVMALSANTHFIIDNVLSYADNSLVKCYNYCWGFSVRGEKKATTLYKVAQNFLSFSLTGIFLFFSDWAI